MANPASAPPAAPRTVPPMVAAYRLEAISGDLHSRFSDEAIALTPKFHLGAGAEFRGLKILHLRGGAAVITDGVQYSGGVSLVLGPLNLSAAAALQTGDIGENALAQFAISFGNR